jgi:hypothetical protein
MTGGARARPGGASVPRDAEKMCSRSVLPHAGQQGAQRAQLGRVTLAEAGALTSSGTCGPTSAGLGVRRGRGAWGRAPRP